MSNRIKIELIAKLLRQRSHQIDLISQGEVVEHSLAFYPAFAEQERFDPEIPVEYASAVPIRRLNGFWSSRQTLEILRNRHRITPYDLVIIFNLKQPQIACANYAVRHFKIPVILEYEDDVYVDVGGQTARGIRARQHLAACEDVFKKVSGCVAVSPHLLAQLPVATPKLLLRGVVGEDIVTAEREQKQRKNVILFAGTHRESNGVAQLIEAWKLRPPTNWELHITGYGEETPTLQRMAGNIAGVVFHGLVSREDVVRLMCSARICMNPHVVSKTPGNVFAFKIVEYLAAGAHVVTTPMGVLEPELEAGITYMADNAPTTIVETLSRVIAQGDYTRSAAAAAQQTYGSGTVSRALDELLLTTTRSKTLSPSSGNS
jgi:glycosyltransferase involved in cell wall biosynthesis